ncbi:hypothetical protein ACFPYI_20990 [Halomarina salina]|uniref:Uncharacterized protein n=1 Tax=Halomarina salina TaxID=1872699 RepID=A0ABD5RTZ6_9EURY|nr:hypothetical protein [Halomarina salina]
MTPGRAEGFERAADGLTDVVDAIDDVDLNAMQTEDVRTVLDARETLEDLTGQYRHDQRAYQRNQREEE